MSQHGLFGKLPAKRDFIAVGAPQEFVRLWEVWLQGAVSDSMMALGAGWKEIYFTAPIWRFWLGHGHAGRTIVGAFMPSLDGVGRCFPLTLVAAAPADEAFPTPLDDPQEEWFAAAEELLLSTLEQDEPYERTTATLQALEPPRTIARDGFENEFPVDEGMLGVRASEDATEATAILSRLAAAELHRREATASYWWTIGGEGLPPVALRSDQMPPARLFSRFLTGFLATPQASDPSRAEASTGADS